MATQSEQLKERTKQLALRIIRLFRSLPQCDDARIIGRQFLRSGTSVAANYRAACRARSKREFIAKMGVVVEEADETELWISLLGDAGMVPRRLLTPLHSEIKQLLAIFSASLWTARNRRKRQTVAPTGNDRTADTDPMIR